MMRNPIRLLFAAAALAVSAVQAQEMDAADSPDAVESAETSETAAPAQGPAGDVIVITGSGPALPPVPKKGMAKSQVTRSFGQPSQKRPPVGGGSRAQPPITRWDYGDYVVFFEYDHVVDTVRRNRPAPIQVRDGLEVGETTAP